MIKLLTLSIKCVPLTSLSNLLFALSMPYELISAYWENSNGVLEQYS